MTDPIIAALAFYLGGVIAGGFYGFTIAHAIEEPPLWMTFLSSFGWPVYAVWVVQGLGGEPNA